MNAHPCSDHERLAEGSKADDSQPISCPDCGKVLFVPPDWNWFPAFRAAGGAMNVLEGNRFDPLAVLPRKSPTSVAGRRGHSDSLAQHQRWFEPLWSYDFRHYATFGGIAVVATASGLWSLQGLVEARWPSAYGFLYERTPVQWAILAVFVFVIVVLGDRLLRYAFGARPTLRSLAGPGDLIRTVDDSYITNRLAKLTQLLRDIGPPAAAAAIKKQAEKDRKGLRAIYQTLTTVISFELGLGIFGSFLGMKDSIFKLSTTGTFEDFVAALATALDTTIFAMCCIFSASALVIGIRPLDVAALRELTQRLAQSLNLEVDADESADDASDG